MPQDIFRTDPEQIESRLRRVLRQRGSDGELLFPDQDLPGTPGYDVRRMLTELFTTHYDQLNNAFSTMSPRTAEGASLDQWAQFFDMPRKGSRPASGRAMIRSELTGSALETLFGSRTITAGTRLFQDNRFVRTTDEARIPEDGRTVEVRVRAAQAADSFAAATILSVDDDTLGEVVEAEVLTSVEGGSISETDTQLRFRLVRALTSPTTYEGFLARLLSHGGVSEASIEENTYGPGTVSAFVVPTDAFPGESLRLDLEDLWEGPGRAYVTMPVYEALMVKIATATSSGIDAAVSFVNNIPVGGELIISQLEREIIEAGADDARVVGIKRGLVGPDGTPVSAKRLAQITNLTPRSGQHKWLTRSDWITLCEGL